MIHKKSNQILNMRSKFSPFPNFKFSICLLFLAFSVLFQGGDRQSRSKTIKSNISMLKRKACTRQHCKQIIKYDDYGFNVCFAECEKQRKYSQRISFIIAFRIYGFLVFLRFFTLYNLFSKETFKQSKRAEVEVEYNQQILDQIRSGPNEKWHYLSFSQTQQYNQLQVVQRRFDENQIDLIQANVCMYVLNKKQYCLILLKTRILKISLQKFIDFLFGKNEFEAWKKGKN